jgi:FixJ family two-component response regulator
MPASQPVIAIVDDEVSMLRALGRLLRSAAFTAVPYTSAEQFLRSGMQQRLGCLVLDVQMPGMTDLDLMAHLVTSGVTLPVIILTGLENEQMRLHAVQAGVIAYLQKPCEDDALLQAIQLALVRHCRHQT